MKRAITISLLSVLLTLTALVAALYSALQTKYATSIVNYALPFWSAAPDSVEAVRYIPPLQFELSGVHYKDHDIYLPHVQIWFNSSPWQHGQWVLDSLLIKEANITSPSTLPTLLFKSKLKLHQLAFQHSDFSGDTWSLRGVNAQVKQPNWNDESQIIPFGEVQFSASQLYVLDEAYDNLLIDLDYKPENSTAYGISFDWNNTSISGQSEQFEQGWSLVNVTIKDLTLRKDTISSINRALSALPFKVHHINSLDLIASNIDIDGFKAENLALSTENFSLSNPLWEQEGYLSFDADMLNFKGFQFIDISAQANFHSGTISISELNSEFSQGSLNFTGVISPTSFQAKQFSLSGVKWLDQTQQKVSQLVDWIKPLETLTIENLDINNAQFIQLQQQPYWQLSGLNIEGKQLTLIDRSQPYLWQGSVSLSANSASWGDILSSQPIIKAYSDRGAAHLERLFIPFEDGYFELTGAWDKSKLSQPWSLEMHGASIPLQPITQKLEHPFSLLGNGDIEGQLRGLAGDKVIFTHTLSGDIDLALLDSGILFHEEEPLVLQDQHLSLNADRGRIRVQDNHGSNNIASQVDLVHPQGATVILKTEQACGTVLIDLISGSTTKQGTCH
ncbi:AsmA family protein [Vibrio sonorensis]|uniref:AsmA family protein n=1 Tax=Vibrio sonorensis TaxID=1004316 RepID=UPI000AB6EEA4|nr:AsmA family protein [Vibrio sonorensis]